jgi:hypothetical protein
MAVLFSLNFRILYGLNKNIRGEFGNSAHAHIHFITCRWITCIIATMLFFVGHCFTVFSNKLDWFWIKQVREETKVMTKATVHYHLTHSITLNTLQFNNVHLQRHVFYRNCVGSLNRKLISTEQRRQQNTALNHSTKNRYHKFNYCKLYKPVIKLNIKI